MSALDVLVLLPLIPALPILVTWWLPWEKWVPWEKIPKAFFGPYIFYGAFASWYFRFDRWITLIAIVWGVILCILAVREKVIKSRSMTGPGGLANGTTRK